MIRKILPALALIGLAACSSGAGRSDETQIDIPTQTVATATVYAVEDLPTAEVEAPAEGVAVSYGYTYHRADGNRLVEGQGAFPQAEVIDIALDGTPLWVVGAADGNASVWAVALDDGEVVAFRVVDGQVQRQELPRDTLPAGMPPVLRVEGGTVSLLTAPPDDWSEVSHPIQVKDDTLVYISANGDLVVIDGDIEAARLPLNALPDGRIMYDGGDRLLLLVNATDRYAHGIMGDEIEAGGIALIDISGTPEVAAQWTIDAPQVIEGIMPMWTDLTGDGQREVIVTVSDGDQGAQILVFDEAGNRIMAGDAIGLGGRWRHQIAVAPFAPDGTLELVDVLTPHIGGIVEFFAPDGDHLPVLASVEGYTSHTIRSRNLDKALAGDFDGDGRIELLTANQAGETLAGIQHTENGAEVMWQVALGEKQSSNMAAVTQEDGGIVVGVGLVGGTLRLWLP